MKVVTHGLTPECDSEIRRDLSTEPAGRSSGIDLWPYAVPTAALMVIGLLATWWPVRRVSLGSTTSALNSN
jgi:hypothetical protein